MGITLESRNFSIDIGCGGFMRLRKKVAELTGKEIYNHYCELDNAPLFDPERSEFFKEYDIKTYKLGKELKIPRGILFFLYASDCDGKLISRKCKELYEVIKDHDDDIAYGYVGRNDCAKFSDFKKIVNDCVKNKCTLKWW